MDTSERSSLIGDGWIDAHRDNSDGIGTNKNQELEELVFLIKNQDAILRPRRGNRSAAIFEIGRALLRAKELVPHGQFLTWVADHFADWPERMAQNCTRVTRVLGSKAETVSGLTFRALIALSADTTPARTREGILSELEGGAELKSRDIERRVRAALGNAVTDPKSTKEQNALIAAALVRKNLTDNDLFQLSALLQMANIKGFVSALLMLASEGSVVQACDD